MKIVKLQYPVENIFSLNLLKSFSGIKLIEVLDIYHYNRLNFSILERITFKESDVDFKKIINEVMQPDTFHIIEKDGNVVLCLMTMKRNKGFWPKIISGNWVINPPIIIDEKFLKITIITRDKFEEVYKKWSQLIDKIEVVAIQNVPEEFDLQKQQILRHSQPYPRFPLKQFEIATYATRNGYYTSPKKISAEEIASHFSISISAVNEHLRKAEKTVMHYFFS